MSAEQPAAAIPPHMLSAATSQVTSRPVSVGPDQNVIVVRADEHQWVSLIRDGVEVVRESVGAGTATFTVPPGEYEIRTSGQLHTIEARQHDLPVVDLSAALLGTAGAWFLRLEADAPSRHPADDMPQIPADGEAACAFTVRKTDRSGRQVTGPDDNEEIFLRSTGGKLTDSEGRERVVSVRLQSGIATFRLVSEEAPKVVTVYAFTDVQHANELRVEFI